MTPAGLLSTGQREIQTLETVIDGVWEMLCILREDEELVACCRLKRFGTRHLGLSELFVAEQYRRQGLAGHLIRRAEAVGRAKGCVNLILGVKRANQAARALYEAHGFADNGNGTMMKALQ